MDNGIKWSCDIKRYCQLVFQIQQLNSYIDTARDDFYDGGYPFDTMYSTDLENLKNLEEEFIDVLKRLTND